MTDTRAVRRFRDLLEPLAACVYFAPELHAAMREIGFGPPSPGRDGISGPNMQAYFTSRGACMGAVSGEVVASAFGVFDPRVVVPAVEDGWRVASRDQVLAARDEGTTAFLDRAVDATGDDVARLTELLLRGADGAQVAARPLYSGLRSLGLPGSPLGDLWRAADLVREHRGDCHMIAWTSAGLGAPEIMLLTELWWGLPRRSYALTRGWSADRYDEADEWLAVEGLVRDDAITEAGLELRRTIEATTDRLEAGVMARLGDDLPEAIRRLEPITASILDAGGYPRGAFQTAADLDR